MIKKFVEKLENRLWKLLPLGLWYLATEGAEAEVVQKAALARLTGVGYALDRAGLRPLVEKHDSRTIDDVRLYIGDVQHLLNLRHSDHVVVRWAANLKKAVDSQANEY
jgi:hypothetical protein